MSDTTRDSANNSPQGLSCDRTHLWVAQDNNDLTSKIFVYLRSDESHASTLDIGASTLSPNSTVGAINNNDQRGMWSNGATLFVVDHGDSQVYGYKLSDRSRDDDKNLTLDTANANAWGLWFDGRVLWVVDDADDKLYVYDLPGAQPENTPASGAPTVTGAPVLSATLTVKDLGSNFLGCDTQETNKGCEPGELLTDNTFSYDSVDYEIGIIELKGGQLSFETDKGNIPAAAIRDLTLNVGALSFPFADATHTAGVLTWSSTGLSWSEDDMIALVISIPAPTQGDTLSADASAIGDATDGLAYVYYHYQWIRDDGTDVTELDGETGATYTTTADDVGKNIQVRVVFDDHIGYREYPRYSPQVTVREVPPEVTSVTLTSDPGGDDTYAIEDSVTATVTFDKAVDVTSGPQITLLVGTADKAADCAAATNTTTMECSYEVVEGDAASSGVGIKANTLMLNGGTIYSTGSTTNSATLTHSALALQSGHEVDGIRPTLITTGNNSPRTSGDGTKVILTFSEDIGSVDRTYIAIYHSGSTVVPTSGDSISGRTVELTLATALTDPTTSLTMDLAVNAVFDTAGNRNDGLVGTTVLNQVNAAPSAPTGLTAEPAPDETPQLAVSLSWTAPASDGGSAITFHQYRYKVGSGSLGSWTTIGNSGANGANATSFTVPGLPATATPPIVFTFEVRAVNANGNGSESNQDTATMNVPGASTLTVTTESEQASFAWTTADNNGSRILRHELTVLESVQGTIEETTMNIPNSGPGEANANSYTLTGLTNGQSYSFGIAAVNSVGTGFPFFALTVVPGTKPTAPRNLSAEAGDTQVTLRWTAPQSDGGNAIDGYEYQQKTGNAPYGSWTDIAGAGENTTEHTVTGLTNGTTYRFKVRAKNPRGNGPESNEVTAVPRTVPTAPQSFAATAGNGRVQLDWTAPASNGGLPINRYQCRYKAGSGSFTTWANVPGSNVNTTTYTVTGLTNGTLHTFEVRAATASTFGVAASGTATPMAVAPGRPSVTVQSRDTALYVSWTLADDGGGNITEYQVQWKSGAQSFDSSRQQAGLTGTNTRIENLINGTEYDVRVRAMNIIDWGEWSEIVSKAPVEGPSVSLSTETLQVDEGGSGAYSVVITTEPTSAVTIRISAGGDVTTQPNTLRFTASNWNTGQRVTVNAGQDGDADDDTVTITHTVASGSAPEYTALTEMATIQVTVLDDDVPPPPVRGFSAADESQDAIALKWWSERGAAEYQLEYRKRGDTGNWTRVTRGDFDHLPSTSGNRSLTAIATGLECNTTYDFRIRLRGSGDLLLDAFGPHTEVSHKTGQCAQPDQATNLMYTLAPDCATLNWTAPTAGDYTGVRIHRLTLGDANYTVIHEDLNSRPTSYRDCTSNGDGYGDGDGPEYSYMVAYIKSGPRGIVESRPAYAGLHQYGPAFQDHRHAEPRNVRLTLDTDSQRTMTWDAPPSRSQTIRAGLQGASVPVPDPWITGYLVERREFRARADGYFYFTDTEEDLSLWNATMTVGESTLDAGTGYSGTQSTPFGSLTQNRFNHFSARYRIYEVIYALGRVHLTIGPFPPAHATDDWDLVIDGTRLSLADATITDGGPALALISWAGQSLSWANGQQVNVQLVDRDRYGWKTVREGGDGDTSTSFTDDEQANGRKFVYRIRSTNGHGASTLHAIFDWLWDSPHRDAIIGLAATDTSVDDSGGGNTGNDYTGGDNTNSPATGAPTIGGTPQVGRTLTADTSAIADEDGLDDVSYGYQWLAGGSDISGATGSTHTLTASEQGKTVQVRVTLTDDANHVETRTSAETTAVAATVPTAPLSLSVATGDQNQELDASWQAPSSDGGSAVTGYTVQWKEAADSWDTNADVSQATVTGTSHTITGLTGGVEYSVRVIATNTAGDGPASTEAKSTPAGGASEQVVEPENSAPTGLPGISGTPQVDQTLTASTSDIDDADGLTNVSYRYQWIAGGTDIDGATGSSHTLTASQQGRTIQVRVAFTDDRGNAETLTSIATAAVAAAPEPLTVSVTAAAPATHDGSAEFTFEIEFSEEFGLSYRTLRDHAFLVTGGSVERAQRTDKPSNIPWRITVKPQGAGDVSIELPATTDCGAAGAICTGDGRKLSHSLNLTVSGPGQ